MVWQKLIDPMNDESELWKAMFITIAVSGVCKCPLNWLSDLWLIFLTYLYVHI